MPKLWYLIHTWALIICLFSITNIEAQSCYQVYTDKNYFTCGVPSSEFEYMRSHSINGGAQLQSNWCWAACVQMVLNYHGLKVSQESVVERIYGSKYRNRPANELQVLKALKGTAKSIDGDTYIIKSYGGSTKINEIIAGLSGKWPLIVGIDNPGSKVGHALVLTAIYYSNIYDKSGKITGYKPEKVILRDPAPQAESRNEMAWSEFVNRVNMVVKVWVVKE